MTRKNEAQAKEKPEENRFSGIILSSTRAVNDLARQQETVLKKLIAHIDRPFRDKWEWAEWHREAEALQLSQHVSNSFFLDSRALWHNLIEGEATKEKRDWVVFLIYNHLRKTYAYARQELAEREQAREQE